MFKKVISTLSALAVVAGSVLPGVSSVAAASLGAEFDSALSWMNTNGYTMYSTEDGFGPYRTLRRDEAAKFVENFGTKVLCLKDVNTACTFGDAADVDPSLASSVSKACTLGLMRGAEMNGVRYFAPASQITKAQFITTMVRGLEGMKAENVDPWYLNYFNAAKARGITVETDATAIDRPLMRYEAALMLYRARSYSCSGTATTGTTNSGTGNVGVVSTGTTNVVTNGNLTVTLSPSTPGVQYIPGTTNNVRVLKLDLTATDKDAKLTSMNLTLAGLVNRAKLTSAYLMDENWNSLTNLRGFNSDNIATLTLLNGGLVIPKGTTKSVYAAVDLSGSINERFVLRVMNNSDVVVMNGSAAGTYPITSNEVNTTDYSSTTKATVRANTTVVTGGYAAINSQVSVGDTNKQLINLNIDNSASNKAIVVKSLKFRTTDNLVGVLGNFRLTAGAVSTGLIANVNVDNRYITVATNDIVIPAYTTKQFNLYADVVGGEITDFVQLYIENARDVVALESGSVNMAVSITKDTMDAGYAYKIINSKNTINRSTSSPSSMSIPTNSTIEPALIANLNVKQEVNVDKVRVYATGTAVPNCLRNVRLYVDARSTDILSASSYNGQYYEFSLYQYLTPGTHVVDVRVDTEANASCDGKTFKFELNANSIAFGNNAEYTSTSNNTSITTSDISNSAVGSTMTISTPGIEVLERTDAYYTTGSASIGGLAYGAALGTTGVARKVPVSYDNYKAFRFTMRAKNVRDVELQGLNVNIIGDTTNVSAVKIIEDASGAVVLDDQTPGSNTFVSFDGFSSKIERAKSKSYWVLVKLNSSYSGSTNAVDTNDLQLRVTNFNIVDDKGTTVPTSHLSGYSAPLNVVAVANVRAATNTLTSSIQTASLNNSFAAAKFQIKSDDGDAIVRELTVVNMSSGYAGTADASATYLASIDTTEDAADLYLYDEATNNELGKVELVKGVAYFTNLNIPLSQGNWKNLVVKVSPKIQLNQDNTNKMYRLAIHPSGVSIPNSNAVTKIESAYDQSDINGFIQYSSVSNPQYLRASTLVIRPLDKTTYNTNLTTNGDDTKLFEAKFDVEAGNAISIGKLNFKVSSANGATIGPVSTMKVLVNNNTVSSSDYTVSGCVTLPGDCTIIFNSNAGSNINKFPAGSRDNLITITNSVTLPSPVGGSNIGGQLTFSLTKSATDSMTNALVKSTLAGVTPGNVVWSDNADSNLSASSVDWFNEAYIPMSNVQYTVENSTR